MTPDTLMEHKSTARASAIEVRQLTKLFGSQAALSEVTFSVPMGTICGFLGPNGAGKTTTIRCLMDFIRPTSGAITILGSDAQRESTNLKRKIGFLASDMQFNEKWTVKEHLRLAAHVLGRQDHPAISTLFDLEENARVKNLSSGNKQKLAIALAFMGDPELLIMDEPTRGLDPVLQNVLYDLLKDFVAKGKTVFFSSHNLSEVQRICEEVVIIKDGKIITEQDIRDIRGSNIHLVEAVTKQALSRQELAALGVEILSCDTHHASLKVKGDVNTVIAYFLKAGLLDLTVTHASLEDVFLEKYKDSV